MSDKPIRVLLVEDDEDDYVLTKTLVSTRDNANIKLDWVTEFDDALQHACQRDYDVFLVDYRLGERTGIELIQEAFKTGCQAPMILLTGQDDIEVDYSALKLGAADYLVKGRIDAQLLGRSIRYAVRQAEITAELAEKENKYRSLFERSIDAIFVTDRNMVIREANPSLEKLTGYSQDELCGKMPLVLFDKPEQYEVLHQRLAENGQIKDYEVVLMSRDGRKFDCLLSVVAVAQKGGDLNWFQGIVRDITEQKKAQRDLLVAEKLSMTGKIARSIAHEVRNPLTNVNMALEQLREDVPTDDPVAGLYMDIIRRNAERIGQLITEMLNSSKPRELDLRANSFNEAVRETLHLIDDRLRLKGMTLVTEFMPDPCLIPLDKEQFKTALINILVNAVEAMDEEKGVLTVKTLEAGDDNVMVCVEDNGSGLTEEVRQRLFDPFFTRKQGGMGLGLTTTQNIINGHRGSIEVESQQGVGTTFRLIFPKG
ncbi:hybrid sensor histidine kinase/response regulator [Tellurirhabdus rosea]|uniref:hybrid sensor histidine kinase/response regulator n=1 Tax=Tellurirhabdus rosea TaxID=2674997 RepID=UPI00224F8A70|nr:hybrid sensor histidine kinase/response regulator [Tellurirhabdus rosea]